LSQKNGTSASNIQRILGLGSYNSAWAWLHKIRRAMVKLDREPLSGDVEIDETQFGETTNDKRGRGTDQMKLIIAVELKFKSLGRIRIRIIKDFSSGSLHPFIKENIARGSKLITDDWNGYSGIEKYNYIRDIHKSKKDDTEMQHVHLVISLLKRWILGTQQGSYSNKYFDYYLDEFVFRFNQRKSKDRGLLFYRLMQVATQKEFTSVKEIKKELTPTRNSST
jgi:transposase-like protein